MTERGSHIAGLVLKTGLPLALVDSPLHARIDLHPVKRLVLPRFLDDEVPDVVYAACLHELGHAFDPLLSRSFRDWDAVFQCEVRAWKWAMDNAREWTEEMTDFMWMALGSYTRQEQFTFLVWPDTGW